MGLELVTLDQESRPLTTRPQVPPAMSCEHILILADDDNFCQTFKIFIICRNFFALLVLVQRMYDTPFDMNENVELARGERSTDLGNENF